MRKFTIFKLSAVAISASIAPVWEQGPTIYDPQNENLALGSVSFSLDSLVLGELVVRYLVGYKVDLYSGLTFDQIEEIAWFSYEANSKYLWRYGLLSREGVIKR